MTNDEHLRQELDQAEEVQQDESAVPPEQSEHLKAQDPDVQNKLSQMITDISGVEAKKYEHRLVKDLMTAALKLLPDGRDTGELKLMTAAVKELRYAYRVFGQYPNIRKVTIFGSARTPEEHADYAAAVDFSRIMAEHNWMAITGAGDGIMKAGHEGPGREASFGVAIRLPFETSANTVIAGDEKLINFRYFFTRKLMFLSQCDAVAVYPGGFGTMDEVYEVLTLVQTGKSSMIPIVLLEGEGINYWDEWHDFVTEKLLGHGMINDEDRCLYKVCKTANEGVEEIERFYRNYHSSRYVRDDYIIRMNYAISEEDLAEINEEFAPLVKTGKIVQCGPYPEESDHLDMPRLAFTHTRYHYAVVRKLIDRINMCDPRSAK
jgi:uncharacterized protein (TIGR00730 family)